jgi:hypothetical protein
MGAAVSAGYFHLCTGGGMLANRMRIANRKPDQDARPNKAREPYWGGHNDPSTQRQQQMKLIPVLTAVALVAAISYGFARGGDHGGGGGGGGGEKSYGGSHQTWCDVDPHCNGWDVMIAKLSAHPYPTEWQDPYVVGSRTVPMGAYAMAQPKTRLAQVQRKPNRIAIRRPLNILPPIAVTTPPQRAAQTKMPSFASTLFGIQ